MADVASLRVETSTIGYLCHATSLITLALTMAALFSAEISSIYQERDGDTFHHDFGAAVWILGTAWTLELFTLVSGLFTPDIVEEPNSVEISDSFLMLLVYSVLGCFYKIMASKNSGKLLEHQGVLRIIGVLGSHDFFGLPHLGV